MTHTTMLSTRRTVLATLLAGLAATAAADSPVVISQVYGAGGNANAAWNRDFVELFNRSGSDVNLGGLSIQYQSSSGNNWINNFTRLPDFVLKPGQYFLVTGAQASGKVGAEVGQADQTGTIDLSGSAGKVVLARVTSALPPGDGGDAVLDLVGFGSAASRFEGRAPAPGPSTANSIQRAGLGCQDTDQNADDFRAGPTTGARRSTSPFNVCSNEPVAQPIVLACPASVQAEQGGATSAILRASDADSIVDSAVLAAGARPGIALSGFTPAGIAGGSASATLDVDGSLAAGSYPVSVTFANNDGQSASCTVTVTVAGQLSIPQIQGSNATSPYANSVQTTQGVVTAKVSTGYFLQDPNGDGDPTTSDGIFVYIGREADVAIGDLLRITGSVVEYTPSGGARSYTEFKDLTATTLLASGRSVAPTNIAFPSDLARVEGMLVRITTPLTVNGNAYLAGRGELSLSYGRREIPTNRHAPGSAEARALAQENAANLLVLDDGIFTDPPAIPYLFEDGTVRSGDTVSDLTGVVDYGAMGGGGAAFKLQPTVTPTFSRSNARTEAPVLAAGNVKVASANVLNFFTTFTDGGDAWGRSGQGCTVGQSTTRSNCRGADNMAEFVRQRDKIVASLSAIDADVVGLMEIQNNGDTAAGYLVEQLNAKMGAGTYAVVPKPATTGTDAIRVAMIYKPGAVTLAGAALSDGDEINNRPPMAQTFQAKNGGGKFSLVVNHLKSKGGCSGSADADDRDRGDGQGCWNGTRVKQSERLRDHFLPLVARTSGDSDILVVGDMNAYGMEDPIRLLNAAGYVNELERLVRPQGIPYSYVFGSESGYLDHALASASLSSQVVGATEWHSNADEPEAIDYNIESGADDPYVKNAYRASDHDPVVVSLNLQGTSTDVTASVKLLQTGLTMNRGTLKYTGKVTFTNTGSTPLAGPLHFVLQGLSAGVSLDGANGSRDGAPYLTLPLGLAPGTSVTVTTIFSNPSKGPIGYTPKLFSGAF